MTTLSLSCALIIVAALVSWGLTPWVIRLAKKLNILDHPQGRKSHAIPTPQLGGIAIFIGFIIAMISILPVSPIVLSICLGSSLIVIVGLIDDIMGMRPRNKLLAQIIIASLTTKMGLSIGSIHLFNDTIPLGIIGPILTVFWIVGLINCINLLDGVDGLAAGVTGIAAFFLSISAFSSGQPLAAYLTLALSGACLGFLRFNFSPAKIFMGDTGSMLLGYLMATISVIGVLKSTAIVSFLIPILILGIPISDTTFSIIRRMTQRKSIFEADNHHFHHQLMRKGLNAKQVSLLAYATTIVLSLISLYLFL